MSGDLIPWYYLPQTELVRFKAVEFFPPKPRELSKLKSICIGTKSHALGDALVLTTLPRKLKELYPELQIYTYPRGFNPVVFWNNPYVEGVTWFPGSLYGDDCNEGTGHLIELKESFFGLRHSSSPRPEIYLSPSDINHGKELIAKACSSDSIRSALPLLVLHPAGQTVQKLLLPEFWSDLVQTYRDRFRIIQIGIQDQNPVPGCDGYFLSPKKRHSARLLFSLLRHAQSFIGVDSGPMHIAQAFGIPSLILYQGPRASEVFTQRHQTPYFLHQAWRRCFLYEDSQLISVTSLSHSQLIEEIAIFLRRIKP